MRKKHKRRKADAPHEDSINHPAHYGGADNPHETIKVLQAWLTDAEFKGFCLGNALKYLSRCNDKGGREDVGKALWYLRHWLEVTGSSDTRDKKE